MQSPRSLCLCSIFLPKDLGSITPATIYASPEKLEYCPHNKLICVPMITGNKNFETMIQLETGETMIQLETGELFEKL